MYYICSSSPSISFPRNTTCSGRAKNGCERGIEGFFLFLFFACALNTADTSRRRRESGCKLSLGFGGESVSISMLELDVDWLLPVCGSLLREVSGVNVGGAGICREVLQDVHVYATACPCEDEAG